MKTGLNVRNWLYYVVIILILIIIFSYALKLRWKDALLGISWNTRWWLCNNHYLFCLVNKPKLTVNFGVYDPQGKFSTSDFIAFEHYFIDWQKIDSVALKSLLKQTFARNRWPLLTIEPWVDNSQKNSLLSDISSGKYDTLITNVCSQIGNLNHPVMLRFAHEMERTTGRYPWAVPQADQYISAYRQFVSLCKPLIKESYFVWSPAGNNGLERYWPGSEYVDYIGLSIYHFPQYEKDTYHQIFSFGEIFIDKYNRIKNYSKPIMLAEVGVLGDKQYQTNWLRQAMLYLTSFPLVKTLVYFNAVDSLGAWPSNYNIPDWHIDPSAFELPSK